MDATSGGRAANTAAISRKAFRAGAGDQCAESEGGVFFVALLPQFLPHHASTSAVLQVVAVAAGIAAGWYILLAMLMGGTRSLLTHPSVRRWIDGAIGAALVSLGTKVAATR